MGREDFTFFWGGEFSQWYPSVFEVDGITYNCAEQYMMEQKARFFKDAEIAEKIMQSKSPREQKALGRQVRNFDADKWMEVCYDIVKKGNLAKFSQNPYLLDVLATTKGTEIVEASPDDKIWGIGYSEHNKLAWNKETWDGLNLLGKVLDDVRDELLSDGE